MPDSRSDWISALPKSERRLAITSRFEEQSTYVSMEVVSFTDLQAHAETLIRFVEDVWFRLLPRAPKLEATVWMSGQTAAKSSRRYGLTPGGAKWSETREWLLGGRIEHLHLTDWDTYHSHRLRVGSDVCLDIHLGSPYVQIQGHRWFENLAPDPRDARYVSVCLDTRLLAGSVSADLQQQMVRLVEELFVTLNGACGFITMGDTCMSLPLLCAYERRIGMAGPNTRRLWRDVRGVFWGNWLSQYHVQRLGGEDYVRREAPCRRLVALASSRHAAGSDGIYLQTTEELSEPDPQAYADLEAFLKPILISTADEMRCRILEPALVDRLGGPLGVKQAFVNAGLWAVELPIGAVLIEYSRAQDVRSRMSAVMQWVESQDPIGYRSIPQLRSLEPSDEAAVWTLKRRVTPRPRGGPIFPAILVEPGILGDAIELRVLFAQSPAPDAEQGLQELVLQWAGMRYDLGNGEITIAECSHPERQGDHWSWYARLDPVGQPAYFQLVLMLDEFSRTKARLVQLDVASAERQV